VKTTSVEINSPPPGRPLQLVLPRLRFGRLRFEAQLEREFLARHWNAVQPRVQIALYLILFMVLGCGILDHWVLRSDRGLLDDVVRFGVQLPLALLGLSRASRAEFQRRFVPLAPVAALVFGLGSVVLAVAGSGTDAALLGGSLLLTTIFSYFLLGLSFRDAARINAVSYIAFEALGMALCVATHASPQMFIYLSFVLVCANLFGAAGCYALEHASRLAFLERRMLTEVATHDGLTGLLNRAAFEQEIHRLWDQAARERLPIAVIMIDIDHFKAFNDRYGHPAGDDCLRRVARAVRQVASRRPLDFVARYGGEELIAVLFGADPQFAERAGWATLDEVSRLRIEHADSATQPYVTISIGATSVLPGNGVSHQDAVRRADEALYRAKAAGRDRCVLLTDEPPAPGGQAGAAHDAELRRAG
jgi:diguanylate cyclase (GGDEF)-like protein